MHLLGHSSNLLYHIQLAQVSSSELLHSAIDTFSCAEEQTG